MLFLDLMVCKKNLINEIYFCVLVALVIFGFYFPVIKQFGQKG